MRYGSYTYPGAAPTAIPTTTPTTDQILCYEYVGVVATLASLYNIVGIKGGLIMVI